MAQLPLQESIDRSSTPSRQGFGIREISYNSKVRQVAFDGPTQESSREEVWTIRWSLLERLTPAEVITLGRPSTFDTVKDFYEDNYLGTVEWRPFESDVTGVWRIVPNSLQQKNPAGCIFNISFKLQLLYNM